MTETITFAPTRDLQAGLFGLRIVQGISPYAILYSTPAFDPDEEIATFHCGLMGSNLWSVSEVYDQAEWGDLNRIADACEHARWGLMHEIVDVLTDLEAQGLLTHEYRMSLDLGWMFPSLCPPLEARRFESLGESLTG